MKSKIKKRVKRAQIGLEEQGPQLLQPQDNFNWLTPGQQVPGLPGQVDPLAYMQTDSSGSVAQNQRTIPLKRKPNGDVVYSKSTGTGLYKDNPYVNMANTGMLGVTALANTIRNNKLKRQEEIDVMHTLEPSYNETDGLGVNSAPIYTQYGGDKYPYGGGPLTSEGAKEMLRDGKAHGKNLTAKQKRYFGWVAGGKKKAGGGCDDCEKEFQAGGSIYNYLQTKGIDGSLANRKKLFGKYIKNYKGTAEQNIQLLNSLESGDISLPSKTPQIVQNKAGNLVKGISKGATQGLESGVITDKHTNTQYVVKNGQVVKSFPVLTGENVDQNTNIGSVKNLSKNRSGRGTPTGSYFLQPNADIYGEAGFDMNPIPAFGEDAPQAEAIAQHYMYDPRTRSKYFNLPGDQRNKSYGCINCRKPDINFVTREFPKGDTSIVLDSRTAKGRAMLKNYGVKQTGGSAMPANKAKILADQEAARFSHSRGLLPDLNMLAEGIPQYTDASTGLPYKPLPTKPRAYTVPNSVQLSDIQGENGLYWYTDPVSGDLVDVDPSVLNTPRFRKPQPIVPTANPAPVKQAGGLPSDDVEAEAGEIIETGSGQIIKISNKAPRHEKGGVKLRNVSRVLENTSKKRKDKASKALVVTPEENEALFGFKTKGNVSHSQAFELAKDRYDKGRKEIRTNNDVINARPRIDKFAANSARMNYNTLADIPSNEDVYDALFMHQEQIKNIHGIQDDGDMSKYGKKAQTGLDNTTNDLSGEPDLYGKGWKFVKRAGDKDYYKKPNGQIVAVPGTTVSSAKRSNFTVDDILNQPKKYATFHRRMAGAPDDVKRKAAEDLLRKGTMPGQYQIVKGEEYGYVPLPGESSSGPTTTAETSVATPATQEQGANWDTSVNVNPKLNSNGSNPFFEPLYPDEILPAELGLIGSLNRDPEIYNPVQFNKRKYHTLDPSAILNANQADYNAALDVLSGMDLPNVANLQAQKYQANATVIGGFENQNKTIKNAETDRTTDAMDRQSVADAQQRATYYQNVQMSKEAQRQQRLQSVQDISRAVQLKRRQNRSGNLLLKLSPAFDQYGEYNGYQFNPVLPPELGMDATLPIINTSGTSKTATKRPNKMEVSYNMGERKIKRTTYE